MNIRLRQFHGPSSVVLRQCLRFFLNWTRQNLRGNSLAGISISRLDNEDQMVCDRPQEFSNICGEFFDIVLSSPVITPVTVMLLWRIHGQSLPSFIFSFLRKNLLIIQRNSTQRISLFYAVIYCRSLLRYSQSVGETSLYDSHIFGTPCTLTSRDNECIHWRYLKYIKSIHAKDVSEAIRIEHKYSELEDEHVQVVVYCTEKLQACFGTNRDGRRARNTMAEL